MKQKPAVKNELFLYDALTLHDEDVGVTLRLVLQYDDMMKITVLAPPEGYKDFMILLTKEQVDQIITLYNEWKD